MPTPLLSESNPFTQLSLDLGGGALNAPPPHVAEVAYDTIESKMERALGSITQLLRGNFPCAVSFSAGKDSSALLNLVLTAAIKMKRRGEHVPPIAVLTASTGVENPDVDIYAEGELAQVREFARKHQLNVAVEVAHPNLTEDWVVRVIGGRGLPTFPGGTRECAVAMKVNPLKRLRKRVMQRLTNGQDNEPVVLIGTRYEESAVRSANMRERGESDVEVRRGIDESGRPGHLFMSPLAHWTTDDVWEMLGMARAGAIPSYSNFEETFRVYADAMGSSCVIIGEDMSKGPASSKACGSRHGCSLCTASPTDKSMENMLTGDPRYQYMRGLNQLRNFVSNTRWDMDRRSWVGRTINEGYIRISPDAYSPGMMEELLRYALTLDVIEQAAARRAGLAKPRFQLIDIEQLFAIDSMWSLQAFHRPFHALKIYNDIYVRGERYHVPDVPVFPRPKEIPSRYLHVGSDWDEGDKSTYTGLRSAILELVGNESQGCMENRLTSSGKEVLAINTGPMLSFDVEAAAFVLDEADELIAKHHDNPASSPTEAYLYYARLGMMTIKAGQEAEVDNMLRRSAFKVRHGLDGAVDPKAVWDRAVTAEQAGLTASNNGKPRARGDAGSRSTIYLKLEDSSPAESMESSAQSIYGVEGTRLTNSLRA